MIDKKLQNKDTFLREEGDQGFANMQIRSAS